MLQLYLSNAPYGTVWWDDISLERISAPPPRPVTIASINLRPQGTGSPEKSVDRFIEIITAQVTGRTDVILLLSAVAAH